LLSFGYSVLLQLCSCVTPAVYWNSCQLLFMTKWLHSFIFLLFNTATWIWTLKWISVFAWVWLPLSSFHLSGNYLYGCFYLIVWLQNVSSHFSEDELRENCCFMCIAHHSVNFSGSCLTECF
jgi:hypothetical protein